MRDAILDTAANLVAEYGPLGVTMSRVAEQVGIGRGAAAQAGAVRTCDDRHPAVQRRGKVQQPFHPPKTPGRLAAADLAEEVQPAAAVEVVLEARLRVVLRVAEDADGASAEDDDTTDIRSLEQQFQELTREREQLVRAIRGPAVGAGDRRS